MRRERRAQGAGERRERRAQGARSEEQGARSEERRERRAQAASSARAEGAQLAGSRQLASSRRAASPQAALSPCAQLACVRHEEGGGFAGVSPCEDSHLIVGVAVGVDLELDLVEARLAQASRRPLTSRHD